MKHKITYYLVAGCLGLLALTIWTGKSDAETNSQRPLKSLNPSQQEALAHANHLSVAFQCVAKEVLPSVVAIESIRNQRNGQGVSHLPEGRLHIPSMGSSGLHFFDDLLEQLQNSQNPTGRTIPNQAPLVSGIGTGVIIDSAGIVMTNHHVIADADKVRIRTMDGREFLTDEILSDPKTDIAILKIKDPKNLTAAILGNSDESGVGEWVLALGQPFGLENSVTAGIISAKQRGIGITARESFIQTDAAINPGNSGGPLVNLRGEVIGINTAIHSRSGGNNGIGFAIPANLAKWVSEQLLEKGGVNRAYLGIAMQSLNPKLAEHLNVGPREGVVVTEVIPGSPADQAGIQIGDVITHLGSQAIKSPKDLQLAVEQSAFGSENPIQMVRNQKPIEVTYVAQPNPNQNQTLSELSDSYTKPKSDKLLGMNLSAKAEHSDANSEVVGLRVISVEADGNAAQAGISNGTLLIEANHITLDSIDVLHRIFDSATQKGDQSILVLAENNGIRKFVVIPIA